jgi:hypothetical protein
LERLIEFITDPVSRVFFLDVLLIAVAAFLAIFLIIISTRRSIKVTVEAMSKALARSDDAAREEKRTGFVTRGRGVVTWGPAGLIYVLKRSCVAPAPHDVSALDELAYDDLRQRFGELGFDVRDVLRQPPASSSRADGVNVVSTVVVMVRDRDAKSVVDKVCMGTGFRPPREHDIEIIGIDDAERDACQRAIDDATLNAEALAAKLGFDSSSFGITEIRLDSVVSADDWDGPNGRVVKMAELVWRRVAESGSGA